MKKGLTAITMIVLGGMCIWLAIQNENLQTQLKEETEIKYEYSQIIDSLMSEIESQQIEGIRHWNEELETHYAPHYKTK